MKFHRPLLVAGLASIGSALFVAQAQNNEAQTKALEALRKAQSGSAAVAAPAPSAVRSSDSPAQEKALQALRQQQSGTGAPAPSSRAPMTMPTDTPAQKKAIEALYGKPSVAPAPATFAGNAAQMKALEALRMHQEARPVAIPVQDSPAQTKALQALNDKWANPTAVPASAQPVESVKPKVPVTEMERLADLTRRYKADEMTPHEYHAQRAKIVSEP